MCKAPLKGFQIGWTEKRKPNYMICSYHVSHVTGDKQTIPFFHIDSRRGLLKSGKPDFDLDHGSRSAQGKPYKIA